MDFIKVPTIIGIIILAIHSVSSFDCSSPTGQVTCECTDTSIECTGILKNVSEIEDVLSLANFSLKEIVVIKMDDLKFGPDFAFVNTSIRNLTLGYGLETLPSHFFQGSSSLVSLNLEKNRIQDIDDQLFSSLPALEELVLDGNDLLNLTSSIFMNLSKLKRLSMAGNHLREIDADLLQYLSALEILTLNRNNISSIGNLRMTSTSVVELNVARCSMKGALEKDSFSGLPNLERLDLSHNELSEVKPHSLSTLKNLEHLDLSHNSIHRLEGYAFSEMRNLTTLDLKHNGISVLKETCFENLKKLVYLDLSSNNMTAVLCDYTTHFDSLEKIYLQNNRIKTFTQGAFFYSPNLKVLNITGNNLECSCSLTDTALYLIENSTLPREDLESISCVIKSSHPTISSITDYKSSKCSVPLEQCKRPDDTHQGSSDEDDYDYDDYSDEMLNETDTTISPMTTELNTPNTTSTMHTTDSNITSESSTTASSTESTTPTNGSVHSASYTALTTEPSTASTTQLTKDTAGTSIPPTEPSTASTTQSTKDTVATSIPPTEPSTASTTQSTKDTAVTSIPPTELVTVESTSLTVPNTSTIKTTSTILITQTSSVTESTMPANNGLSNTTSDTFMTTESTAATSIPSTEPVTVENTSLLITGTSTIKTTPDVLKTDVSTRSTTVTGIIPSNTAVGDSCSLLDLSVEKFPLDSKFMVFRNFSYDGTTFCLKWTIVGDLKDVKSCVMKYTFSRGTKHERVTCPLVSNEIISWRFNEEIYKMCLEIYAPKRTSFCNRTWYGRTTAVVSETTPLIYISHGSTTSVVSKTTPLIYISHGNTTTVVTETTSILQESATNLVTETTPFKATETVGLTEDSTDNLPDHFTISVSVYSNNSNLAFAMWTVSAEAPLNVCTITLTSSTANQPLDYKEGDFPCRNNSHRLRNVKETDIFKVCIVSRHEKYGEAKECTLSVSPALESKSEREGDSHNSAFIPLICLLVLLIIIVAIIIFKNMRKQESKKYNVRDEENKYDQRVKVRPQSTSDQSIRFSYLARENYDCA